MISKLSGWDDSIVAIATPPGVGAIGVLRLSGTKAIDIANKLFPAKDLTVQSSHTLHVGALQQDGLILDEVVLSLFKAPRSYTGENVVEISCHGSPFIQQRVLEACIQNGARLAKPGEFTQRAFLSGKLDLTQAEAVADLIQSNSSASQQAAVNAIRGGFSLVLKALRNDLLSFSSLLELELDFAEEDVAFADRTQLRSLVDGALLQTGKLLQSFKIGNVVKKGVSVAIVGKPNAGKSTLLNALLQEDRAIVSEVAGTTRDTIEEAINIGGVIFRLIDTAGIRSHTADAVENAGIERSREKMRHSDMVIYLFDAGQMEPAEIAKVHDELKQQGVPFLLVGNKCDTIKEASTVVLDTPAGIIFIAAQQALHLDELQAKMVNMVLSDELKTESIIVTNARHFQALQEVHNSLLEVREGMDSGLTSDLLALDIRRSLHYLGEITGETTNEDQLEFIFSKFCIGK